MLPFLALGLVSLVSLVKLGAAPAGETVDGSSRPSCMPVGVDDDQPSAVVRTAGRTLRLSWKQPDVLEVHEGAQLLWTRSFPTAGPIGASFCTRSGWHVVHAGVHRHGLELFDVFTGKKLARADSLVTSADGKWALVPPPTSWALGCFEASRAFRIPLDGSGAKKSLDTPPLERASLCTEQDAGAPARDEHPAMTVSPAGDLYAYADSRELAVYDAATDTKLASFPNPPKPTNLSRLRFASSAKYIVLDSTWFEIRRAK